MQRLIQEWNSKVQRNDRIQLFVRQFRLDTTKSMENRLELLGLTYDYLKMQYESTSPESFVKWLSFIGVKYKVWHEKICIHFKKICKK